VQKARLTARHFAYGRGPITPSRLSRRVFELRTFVQAAPRRKKTARIISQ
jgi:hypothetical protein